MLLPNGHLKIAIELEPLARELVTNQDWNALDALAKQWLSPTGKLHDTLSKHCTFDSIEHILALREAPDDEGIWHDDGSRLMAFSLSLTLNHEAVQGGEIMLREKGLENGLSYPTQPWGTLIIFNTGRDGYEHRVSAINAGKRLVLAGWCS